MSRGTAVIGDAALESYLNELTVFHDPLLEEMEEYARLENVPIIDRVSMQLIRVHVASRPDIRRILEIGTAIGYSAICLAQCAQEAVVHTVEKDEDMVLKARSYLARSKAGNRVQVHAADAKEWLPTLQEKYDMVFIDAAKSQYRFFFEQADRLLNPRGVVIIDNILFRGYVARPAEEVNPSRFKPMVRKLQQFNAWLSGQTGYLTSYVPVGDGLAFCIKREE
jgi:predicted O-methyltransferase YrrM